MMEFYTKKESEAVRMVSDRVREHDDYEYEDWTPDQIINPKLKTHSFKNSFSFINPACGRSRVKKLDDLERWIALRNILEKYPPFIEIVGYDSAIPAGTDIKWINRIEKAAQSLQVDAKRGFAWQNEYLNSERIMRPISLLRLKNESDGLTAEIADSAQIHGQTKHKTAKVLFIHNQKKVAPFKTKAFVAALREILINKSGYDFVYGHPAERDQETHPKNSLTDKRFKTHHSFEIIDDGWCHTYKVSNLTEFWRWCGFLVHFSPEDQTDIAVSFMSDKYKKYLFGKSEDLWQQVIDYNKSK